MQRVFLNLIAFSTLLCAGSVFGAQASLESQVWITFKTCKGHVFLSGGGPGPVFDRGDQAFFFGLTPTDITKVYKLVYTAKLIDGGNVEFKTTYLRGKQDLREPGPTFRAAIPGKTVVKVRADNGETVDLIITLYALSVSAPIVAVGYCADAS